LSFLNFQYRTGFSLNSWLNDQQLTLKRPLATHVIAQLLNVMGVSAYLQTTPCDRTSSSYNGDATGWYKCRSKNVLMMYNITIWLKYSSSLYYRKHLAATHRRCADDLFLNQSNLSLQNPESWKIISIVLYIYHSLCLNCKKIKHNVWLVVKIPWLTIQKWNTFIHIFCIQEVIILIIIWIMCLRGEWCLYKIVRLKKQKELHLCLLYGNHSVSTLLTMIVLLCEK